MVAYNRSQQNEQFFPRSSSAVCEIEKATKNFLSKFDDLFKQLGEEPHIKHCPRTQLSILQVQNLEEKLPPEDIELAKNIFNKSAKSLSRSRGSEIKRFCPKIRKCCNCQDSGVVIETSSFQLVFEHFSNVMKDILRKLIEKRNSRAPSPWYDKIVKSPSTKKKAASYNGHPTETIQALQSISNQQPSSSLESVGAVASGSLSLDIEEDLMSGESDISSSPSSMYSTWSRSPRQGG